MAGHSGSERPNVQSSPITNITTTDTPIVIPAETTSIYIPNTAALVEYSAGWDDILVPQQSGSDRVFHSSSTPNALVQLSFQGTNIVVFGLLPPGDTTVSANYTIDNDPPQIRTLESSMDTQNFLGNSTYFDSGILTNGSHYLIIKVTSASIRRNYTLDYFQILQPMPSGSNSSSSNAGMGSLTTGVFVVGILGATIFGTLLATAFSCWRKRRADLLVQDSPSLKSRLPNNYDAESIRSSLTGVSIQPYNYVSGYIPPSFPKALAQQPASTATEMMTESLSRQSSLRTERSELYSMSAPSLASPTLAPSIPSLAVRRREK